MENQRESEKYAKQAINIMEKHHNLPSYKRFINEAQHILHQYGRGKEVV